MFGKKKRIIQTLSLSYGELLIENFMLMEKIKSLRELLTDVRLNILTTRKVTDDELIEGIVKSINEQLK